MKVRRSSVQVLPAGTVVEGDLSVAGDVIATTAGKGFIAEDQLGDDKRIKPYDDGGTPTTEVENV